MKKFLSVVFGLIMVFSLVACESEEETNHSSAFYVGETMDYDNIDVTVNAITGQLNENSNSDYYGLLKLTVNFTCKNNSHEEFELSSSDFYIKTEDKGEKYETYSFSGEEGLFDFGDSIIAGATKTYDIEFYVPYMIEEGKKYVMCLDWGILHIEQEYCLYYRDGSNSITKTETTDNKNDSDNNKENYSHLFTGSCPVNINATYYTSDQTLSIKQTNQSGKTIVAIKYLIIVYDAYGDVLQQYGYGASSLTATYDKFNINTGVSNTGDWKLNGFSDGKALDIYVFSVYYSDNTEWGSHDLAVSDIKTYAPKTHVIGRYA